MLYESELDRSRERAAGDLLGFAGYQVIYSTTDKPWDMALHKDGKLSALVEFKCRSKAYDTLIIDKSKIDKLLDLSAQLYVTPMLMVKFNELQGYWVWVCHDTCNVSVFQRQKRRGIWGERHEAKDSVYEIPIGEFVLWHLSVVPQ